MAKDEIERLSRGIEGPDTILNGGPIRGVVDSVRKILLVEDEVFVAMAACLMLESLGYRVALAADGHEGLTKAQVDPPDIVVTDYMMPKMDGVEMLRAMRADGYGMPAVLITSVPEERLLDGATKLYQAYLPKPFHDESLIAVIRKLLRVDDAAG